MVQKRGHEAAASDYQKTLHELEALIAHKAVLERSVTHDQKELAEMPARIAAARSAFAEQEQKVEADRAEEFVGLLLATARSLDIDGESPLLLQAWYRNLNELRTRKRIGASVQLVDVTTRRLQGTIKSFRPLGGYERVARGWLSRPTAEAAE